MRLFTACLIAACWSPLWRASPLRQAAFLFQGLLMNHGFKQGNKRTAFLAMGWFLHLNKIGTITAPEAQIITMCYSAENKKWSVDQIEAWLVANVHAAEATDNLTA